MRFDSFATVELAVADACVAGVAGSASWNLSIRRAMAMQFRRKCQATEGVTVNPPFPSDLIRGFDLEMSMLHIRQTVRSDPDRCAASVVKPYFRQRKPASVTRVPGRFWSWPFDSRIRK